jgi:hypothetical protein
MNMQEIEKRIMEVEASYQRQLSLLGGKTYDPKLTEFLKKDLNWLQKEKRNLFELQQPSSEVKK